MLIHNTLYMLEKPKIHWYLMYFNVIPELSIFDWKGVRPVSGSDHWVCDTDSGKGMRHIYKPIGPYLVIQPRYNAAESLCITLSQKPTCVQPKTA